MKRFLDNLKAISFSEWIHVAQTFILFFTVLVAGWSVWKVQEISESAAESSNILQANMTWERYMESAADHPEMAAAAIKFTDDIHNPNDVAYGWFVERVLMAAEQTLSYAPNDIQWIDAFRFEVNRHQKYFISKMFLQEENYSMPSYCTYTRRVRAMIRSSFSESTKEGSDALKALQNSEQNCQGIYKKRKWVDA